jgi:FAD synthase
MSATAFLLVSFDKAAMAVSIQTFVLNIIVNHFGISVVSFMTDILRKKYCL